MRWFFHEFFFLVGGKIRTINEGNIIYFKKMDWVIIKTLMRGNYDVSFYPVWSQIKKLKLELPLIKSTYNLPIIGSKNNLRQ